MIAQSKLKRALSVLSLSTPKHRIITWATLTVAIYVSKFEWLAGLSLYQRVGWEWMPSVGLTRAYWLISHGQFGEAYQMNPLIFPILLIGGGLLIRDAVSLLKPNPHTRHGRNDPFRGNIQERRSPPDLSV